MAIRPAREADVPALVALVEARRRVYEGYQPVFWKKAERSAEMSAAFLPMLLAREGVVGLVAETDGRIEGFLIAAPTPAPPVYDVPGPTYTVDDFAVAEPELWATTGRALLARLREIGRAAGWAQLVVISALADEAKSAALAEDGLSIASTWWTQAL